MNPARALAPALVVISILCAGCLAPQIRGFSVLPRVTCGAALPSLAWNTSGDAVLTLEEEPPPPQDPACARSGMVVYRATLVVTHGSDSQLQRLEVAHAAANATEPIVLETRELVGNDVIARTQGLADPAAELWGDALEIASVTACGGRPLRVAHGGREAALSPASPTSTALQGTSLGGFWEMRSPLSAEELAVPAKRPMQLGIVATLRCKGAGR